MIRTKIYLVFIFILFIGCTNNEIYFDCDTQSLISCTNKGIRNVYISSESSSETYFIEWKSTEIDVPTNLDFRNIQKEYSIYKGWNEILILNKEFKLSPLTSYKIERVQGDASSYNIMISTNEKGKIVKSSKALCK
ncbi:hypothetical protein [Flavobacterium sp.]|uniref:hypothetical protein n=1 Tax=Flavobacterium sp. TaxID=239 RepID=UPI00261EE836|nr:hypothetical protein [Flavobacterium sp.]